jgi:hypothetical protein
MSAKETINQGSDLSGLNFAVVEQSRAKALAVLLYRLFYVRGGNDLARDSFHII